MSRKKITLEVNSEVRVLLDHYTIPIHDGLTYLLCLHYGLDPSFIPEGLERKVLATKIVTKDYTSGTIKWNIPLFEETVVGFEWIKEWMDLFKKVNPDRRGIKADVLRRMKKFFVNHPATRVEDVMTATNNYLNEVDNPKYCKKSHKFIYEADGSSMLADYVEASKERGLRANKYQGDII